MIKDRAGVGNRAAANVIADQPGLAGRSANVPGLGADHGALDTADLLDRSRRGQRARLGLDRLRRLGLGLFALAFVLLATALLRLLLGLGLGFGLGLLGLGLLGLGLLGLGLLGGGLLLRSLLRGPGCLLGLGLGGRLVLLAAAQAATLLGLLFGGLLVGHQDLTSPAPMWPR